jgi:O-antigen/teichoic acid export membrane protein
MVVNGVVALFVTQLCVTRLGHAQYVAIAVVLSFVGIFALLGNATTDACVKFIAKAAADDNWEEADQFMINAVAVAFWITLGACLCSGAAGWLKPSLTGYLPLSFIYVVLAGMFLSLFSGICASGNFYHENFLSSAIVQSLSRIIYGAGVWYGIVHLNLNYWGVAFGSFAGALFAASGAYALFKVNLPRVALNVRYLSFERQGRIVSFIGWMLFVYCGTYCASNAVLLIASIYVNTEEAARLALGLQVGSIAAQVLTCFSLVTSPGIYRALARDDQRLASRYIQLLLDLALPASICGMLIVYFEGNQILRLWLGDDAPVRMVPIILGSFMSFSLVSICIPFCAYYAAANRLRTYGLACLAESLLICLSSILLLHVAPRSVDRIVLIALLPGILIVLKLFILCWFRCAGLSVSFRKLCGTLLFSGLIAAALSSIIRWTSLQNLWLSIAILMVPYGLYLVYQLRRGPSACL